MTQEETNPMRLAREYAADAAGRVEHLREALSRPDPVLAEEIRYSIGKYATPILAQTQGAFWRDDVPGYVQELPEHRYPDAPLEISTRPQDPDGHDWEVSWYLLTENENGELARAIDYEHKRRGANLL